jgi:hypothetical protein
MSRHVTTITGGGQIRDGVRMDAGAVDKRNSVSRSLTGRAKSVPPSMIASTPDSLSFCNGAGRRRRNIGLVHIF